MDPIRSLVESLLRLDLRRAFRDVYWVGSWPPSVPDGPVIAYANHHHYYDGHLGWLLFQECLDRSATLWMEKWDQFPFFGAVGAQPFPADNPSRRAATLRRTAHRFRSASPPVLIYYPNGALRSPDAGIEAFSPSAQQRIASLYPDAQWWPFALHVTWQGHARPTALLGGGPAHDWDGNEHGRLTEHWKALHHPSPSSRHQLLRGRRSASEQWDFSFAAPFFLHYL